MLQRLRDAFQVDPVANRDPHVDLATVRGALESEAERLGRRSGLSLSLLMEYAPADLREIDLHEMLGHLQTRGEIVNVRDDSFGNLRFDLREALLDH